jgi:hypothetical protein
MKGAGVKAETGIYAVAADVNVIVGRLFRSDADVIPAVIYPIEPNLVVTGGIFTLKSTI